MNLSGKVILVTGASRGIGRAIAIELASKGAAIAINYSKDDEGAKATLENVIKNGGYGKLFKKDISNYNNCRELIDEVIGTFGKLDVLVNNAGISKPCLFTDISYEQWDEMISTNLSSVFYVTKKALQYMLPNQSGHIINISSMWGLVGSSFEVDYSATKAGIIGMTKALAKELGPSNINVNAIAPGVIQTDMLNDLSQDTMDMLKEETPLMRIGKPEDIAKCALFLAEQGDFITGQVISSNGGFVI